MEYLSQTEHQARTRREILENEGAGDAEIAVLQRQIADINRRLTPTPNQTEPGRQGILNMIRNGDHAHSVNTWWESAPVTTDKNKECANVYAYPPFEPIVIADAAITTGTAILTAPSNPFTADMVGRWVQVAGAGAAAATLNASIISFTGAGQVTLSINAGTTVSGASARINLLKLAHTNSLNAAATNPNDALKDASHSDIATNISDPDWKRENGTVRLGSTNTIGYTFGRFAENGTTYAALHQLFSGREPFVRFNMARVNEYVKVKGKLYVGIYNNSEAVLDWVQGALFGLESIVDGNPSTTVSTEYVVVLETDQGFTLVSQVETIALAPDDAGYAAGARVRLSWTFYAGTTVATVYRKRGSDNVFKMESFSSGTSTWTDVNLSSRVDTGSAAFPTFGDQADAVRSYWATADGELEGEVPVDGAPGEFWLPMELTLPFVPSINMAGVFDPHLMIGLTEPLATELTDVVTDSTTTVASAAAQFVASMAGKAFTLTKADGTETVTGTVASFTNATTIVLSAAATWTEEGATLVIDDSQPRGLLFDLVGVSLHEGEWDYHVEDNSELRGQPVAANPNGSTQGGPTGGPPTGGGGTGGPRCVLDEAMVSVRGACRSRLMRWLGFGKWKVVKKRAIEVTMLDLLWNGLGCTDEDFNELDWIQTGWVNEITWFLTATKRLPCTGTHRVVNDENSYKAGYAVSTLRQGEKVLISDRKSARLEALSARPVDKGKFRVVSFGLRKTQRRTCHLMVINDVVSHNLKDRSEIII